MLKLLTNKSEHRVFDQVSKACDEFRAEVYRKIRVADVIDIEKCSIRSLGTYALMAHFDFIVSDEEHFPQFAIEFDGSGHDKKNDWKKDKICEEANLALFRVNFQNLNAILEKMSFLRYLVHVWFMAHEFEKMRRSGRVSNDEPFMMSGFLKPNAKHIFDSEYNFTAAARGKIVSLNKKHHFSDYPYMDTGIGHLSLFKDKEKFASFASFDISGRSVYGQYQMNLGIPCYGNLGEVPFGTIALADFCNGRAHNNLTDNLELFLDGGGHTLTTDSEISQQITSLITGGFKMLHGGRPVGHALSNAIKSAMP